MATKKTPPATPTKITELIADDKNFNKGSEFGNGLIEKSLRKFGAGRSILIDKNNRIIAGNKTVENSVVAGLEDLQIVESDGKRIIAVKRMDIDLDTPEGRELALADNSTAKANIVFDAELIEAEVGVAVAVEWGVEIGNQEGKAAEAHDKLTDAFIVPPFTVLDTRQGYWIDRKAYWRELIQDNGESREMALSKTENIMSGLNNGVSLLDPVLAELSSKWFGLERSNVFDPFAGDSVFGYVASYLGNNFTGIELRQEQADLNNARVKGLNARYVCDDARNVLNHIDPQTQDLLFSCPPYFDLEVYSDLPNDASNQKDYQAFLKIIDTAFSSAIKCLKQNRFAVITVGDVRDKNGYYYRFVDHIKDIFEREGMRLYNELILVDALGTLPQRVGRFMQHRKVGKCHQNVLVFYNGNPKDIKTLFPKITVPDFEGAEQEGNVNDKISD